MMQKRTFARLALAVAVTSLCGLAQAADVTVAYITNGNTNEGWTLINGGAKKAGTAAGVKFKAYDPADSDIPGSFGILYTNQQFLTEHPTAAQDFMRATMRGLADALADPTLAATTCVDIMNSFGNTLHLSADGEKARWNVESKLVADSATTDAPLGLPLIDQLTAEVTAYAAIGLFNGLVPEIDTLVDASVLAGIYDNGVLVWPKG